MALTEPEAKVLGALPGSRACEALTARQLSRATTLPESSIRRALMRLVRSGLAVATPQGTAGWRATDRGRLVMCKPEYQEYAGVSQ